MLRIVRELLALEVQGKGTRIAAAIDEVLGIVRKRSVLFVISDFQDVGWERSMAIARRRHDCIRSEGRPTGRTAGNSPAFGP